MITRSIGRRYGSTDRPEDLVNGTANRVLPRSAKAQHDARADYVEAGEMPVVLANRFGGVIFHEACGHLLETTQIERGTTPFADSVGSQIAHPAVTAIDEDLSDGAFEPCPWTTRAWPRNHGADRERHPAAVISDRAENFAQVIVEPAVVGARATPSQPPVA